MTTQNDIDNGTGSATTQAISISGNAATVTKSAIVQNPITDSTTARTLIPTDANALIICSNVGTITVTIDTNANQAIAIGSIIRLISTGGASAIITIAAAGGVTLNNSTLPSVGNNGTIALQKSATDTWTIIQLYEEYAHTTNWSGIWSSNQAGNSTVVRSIRNCVMTIPSTTATQNTAAGISMVTALPARFRPSANSEIIPIIQDSGASVTGDGTISTAGGVSVAKAGYANFSGSGTGGFLRSNFSWNL